MTITNRSNPSTATWHCCQENPAFVGEFANGSAIILCKSCRWSFAQHNDGRSVHELPEGWSAPTVQDRLKAHAESALEVYMAVASTDGPESHCQNATYKATQRAFKAAVLAAYGPELRKARLTAEVIYALCIDSGEGVAYCVNYAVENAAHIRTFRI